MSLKSGFVKVLRASRRSESIRRAGGKKKQGFLRVIPRAGAASACAAGWHVNVEERLRKGASWLKTTLVQCAWAAVKKKNSYLQAQFYRIKVRRGPKKAIMAVAASILTAIYHMLKDGTMYQDLGCNHFDRRSTNQQKKRLVKRLTDLGYAVEIKPLAA
jgi:hypothetical protein